MTLLKVDALWILALKVANIHGRLECQLDVIASVGGLDLGPNMAIIVLIHAVHRFGLGMGRQGTKAPKEEETNMRSPSKWEVE